MLYNEPGKADRAVSESTAFLMASMLADVINAGTAYRARQSGFTLPAAGKTGTTNDYVDAWFVGFTPKLVTGVWIGFDQPKTIIRNGYAGEIAVPLWAGFMKVATKDDKPEWLARPANVIGTNVCRISGKLPAGGCDHVEVVNRDGFLEKRSMIYTEYFVKGTQPTDTVSAARRPRLPRCAGRGLRQGLGPAADAGRCDRPAGAAASAEHRRAPRARPPSPLPRKPSRPRRSAASGRASSAAAATRRTRTERRTSRRKSPAGDTILPPDMPFRHLAGHRVLLDLVARAAARGSLPPSLIFAGPDGVGKRLAALSLAQLFNCTSVAGEADGELAPDACGNCSACRRIARGVHADVLVIEPGDTGSIKVDQVRAAIERTAYRPFEGRRRVVIVDEADAMEAPPQNALLKTLEEPPAASTFVLVTSRPDVLLPTVRSRCQRIRFGPISPAEMASVLMRDHGFEEREAHAAATAAEGSIGRALEGDSEAYVGARDAAEAMLKMAAQAATPGQRLAAARALGGDKVDRDELGRRLRLVASMLRDIGVLLSRADERSLANGDLKPVLARLLPAFDADRALDAFAAVDRALQALDRNASPKIVADWVAFQL